MLDSNGFDGWADEYDAAVEKSINDGTYPFCGYDRAHDAVFERVKSARRVLDLGVGTGKFSERLYRLGASITAVDFSANMIETARRKMPNARFIRADLTAGLPTETDGTFDAVTALYSIHHLTDGQKVAVIDSALERLSERGVFAIGDVAFATETDRLAAKKRAGDAWDDAEYYCVAEKLAPLVNGKLEFIPVSFCAGVIFIENK